MSKTYTAKEARKNISKILRDCQKEPIFITRNGKVVAVFVGIEDK